MKYLTFHMGGLKVTPKFSPKQIEELEKIWDHFFYSNIYQTIEIALFEQPVDKNIYGEKLRKLFQMLGNSTSIHGTIRIIGQGEKDLGLIIVDERVDATNKELKKQFEIYALESKNFLHKENPNSRYFEQKNINSKTIPELFGPEEELTDEREEEEE